MVIPTRGYRQPTIPTDSSGNEVATLVVGATRRLAVDATFEGGNQATFMTNQVNVAIPGTAVQFPAQAIPNGMGLVIKAKSTNTGVIRVGNSAVNAQNVAVAFRLNANDRLIYYLTNANLVWIDAAVGGEGVDITVET